MFVEMFKPGWFQDWNSSSEYLSRHRFCWAGHNFEACVCERECVRECVGVCVGVWGNLRGQRERERETENDRKYELL